MWIAKDKNGLLKGHFFPPFRNLLEYWRCTVATHSRFGDWSFDIPEKMFPKFDQMTWDDNPVEVLIIPKNFLTDLANQERNNLKELNSHFGNEMETGFSKGIISCVRQILDYSK